MYLTISLGDNPSMLAQPNQISAKIWSIVHSCDCPKGDDLRYQRPFIGWYVDFDPVHSDPHEWHLHLINWPKVSCYQHAPSHRILDPRFYTPSQYCKNLVLTRILSFSLLMNTMNWLWIYICYGIMRCGKIFLQTAWAHCHKAVPEPDLACDCEAIVKSLWWIPLCNHATTLTWSSQTTNSATAFSTTCLENTISFTMFWNASASVCCPLPFTFFFETSCSMA